jgi:hypothetical protein
MAAYAAFSGAAMNGLILKRTSASRPSGKWRDDDYDVLSEGQVVGRIRKVITVPADTPWVWTLGYGYHEDRTPTHGYESTREAAMAGVREELAGAIARLAMDHEAELQDASYLLAKRSRANSNSE